VLIVAVFQLHIKDFLILSYLILSGLIFLLPSTGPMITAVGRDIKGAADTGFLGQARGSLGLPGVRFLTGQSGFLGKCPVRIFCPNRTMQCPVFWPSIVICH